MPTTWQAKICVVATVAGLTGAGLKYLEPRTPEQLRQDRVQEQVEQLSDADEANKDRLRRDGEDAAEAHRRDRLRPAEHRPPDRPSVRVRLR